MLIEIRKIGKFAAGEDAGTYVKVLDDADCTRGFLI
jgi:hypothetical protein